MKIKYLNILFGLCLLTQACQVENEFPDDNVLGFSYFPLEVGSFVEYEIIDTLYTLTSPPEVAQYQVREEINSTFDDIEGNLAYRVERFRRPNTNFVWELDSIWVAQRKINQAIRIENNLTFVKLVFPPANGKKWDGNSFNFYDEDTYEIMDKDKSFEINNLVFDNTLRVVQADDSNAVFLDRRVEVYAQNVGLVYKKLRQLAYCTSVPSCIGSGKIDFGRVRIQKMIRYGKNN